MNSIDLTPADIRKNISQIELATHNTFLWSLKKFFNDTKFIGVQLDNGLNYFENEKGCFVTLFASEAVAKAFLKRYEADGQLFIINADNLQHILESISNKTFSVYIYASVNLEYVSYYGDILLKKLKKREINHQFRLEKNKLTNGWFAINTKAELSDMQHFLKDLGRYNREIKQIRAVAHDKDLYIEVKPENAIINTHLKRELEYVDEQFNNENTFNNIYVNDKIHSIANDFSKQDYGQQDVYSVNALWFMLTHKNKALNRLTAFSWIIICSFYLLARLVKITQLNSVMVPHHKIAFTSLIIFACLMVPLWSKLIAFVDYRIRRSFPKENLLRRKRRLKITLNFVFYILFASMLLIGMGI